jgi:hypothetical protein
VKRIVLLSLLVLSAAALQTRSAGAQSPTPQTVSAEAPAPAPPPKPYEEIIKLWKANLSEDFIKRQVQTGTTVYDLSADEVIRLRDAGLPESLINIMLDTKNRKPEAKPAAPAAAPAALPVSASAPAPAVVPASQPLSSAPAASAPAPSASLAAEANRRWEGLARRNGGVVILKSRWDVGVLEFKEEAIRWLDAKDASKNLLIPARQITEQFRTCLKKSGGNECFEWGVRTKDGEYKWRDITWEQGENKKVAEVFDFMRAIYPSLVSSDVPVDTK